MMSGPSRTVRFGTEQRVRLELEPGVDAALLDQVRDTLDELVRARMQLAGLAMREQRQRHAPAALARDAPVGTAGDHAGDALLAPVGHPVHLADLAQRGLAQAGLLHADEPLRRGAEDHRRLVAPAVRIAVRNGSWCSSAPRSPSTSTTRALASNTLSPANNGVAGRKRPSLPRPGCRRAGRSAGRR
jgi:hypothetical protein